MAKTTVVTGAAGFIGSNLVRELNRRGQRDLLLVDTLGTDDKWRNLVGLEFEEIISPEQFLDLLQAFGDDSEPAFDGIVHLGACSATTERDADFLLRNNYAYTRMLAEWSQEHGVRMVYASSAATYGDGSRGYEDDDAVTPTLEPLNMYGYSKQLFDLLALRSGMFTSPHPIAGLKLFNVFGPYEQHKGDMRSVVHKSWGQITAGSSVQLFKSERADYGDGQQMRDFIYVKDAVDVTLWMLDHPQVGGLFNCGTGIARTWQDLVTAVYSALGRPAAIEYVDMPEPLRDKYQYFTEATMTKLRATGYDRPFTTLEDAVRDYVQQYLEHGKGA